MILLAAFRWTAALALAAGQVSMGIPQGPLGPVLPTPPVDLPLSNVLETGAQGAPLDLAAFPERPASIDALQAPAAPMLRASPEVFQSQAPSGLGAAAVQPLSASGSQAEPAADNIPVFGGLERVAVELKEGGGFSGTGSSPDRPSGTLNQFWEKGRTGLAEAPGVAEYEVAYTRRRKEEVKQAQREPDVVEYRSQAFPLRGKRDLENPGLRQIKEGLDKDFLERSFPFGKASLTGRELLEFLVTPHAVQVGLPLDPARVDMKSFGRSEQELQALIKQKSGGVAPYGASAQLHRLLEEALRRGLTYQATDWRSRQTYYGVPNSVRAVFDLAVPEVPAKAAASAAADAAPRPLSPFGASLVEFARRTAGLPAKDETFEFAAQAAQAALNAGKVRREQFPEEFARKAASIDFAAPPLPEALLTLLESSRGTPWFEPASALASAALAEGLLDENELRAALAGP